MQRAFSRRSRWWLAVVQVAMLLATFVMPAAAATDPAPLTGPQLIQLLQTYGIVKGDPSGNLNLDKPITRAEMMTIMVRALGAEAEAELYKGLVTYTDFKGHWAEGIIAYATIKGMVQGDGDGRVRPDDPISYAESLTLIVRLVGKEPTMGDWPINIMLAAADMGIVPPGVNVGNMRESAIRGAIFQSLTQTITSVKLPDGKSFLQTHVAKTAPTLTLSTPVASTKDATVQITGTVLGAHSLTVNGQSVNFSGTLFSTSVALEYGDNTITVVAADMAGNKSSAEAKVSRIHPIASIEIDGPAKVRPGGTASYTISAKDGSGSAAALTGVTATVEGGVGTFNLASKTFTASSTPAKGKIVLTAGTFTQSFDVEVMGANADAASLAIRSVNNGLAVSFTKPMTVQVEVRDRSGLFLDSDYGRPVTLSATGLSGLNVSPATAHTEAGVATFTISSSQIGDIALQASSTGLNSGLGLATFGSNLRVRLTADPGTISTGTANANSTIRARLVNEQGQFVANTTPNDLYVQLSLSGTAGVINNDVLLIRKGASISENASIFSPGVTGGTVTISGTTISGGTVTVDPVSIAVTVPTVGSGSSWDIIGSLLHSQNTPTNLVVRSMDSQGGTISGSFAFQVRVETSNNEAKTNGIPDGVVITLGNTGFNPVSDGIAEGAAGDSDDVIVRTQSGVATLRVSYNKPGQVYLTIVPMGATATAYATDGTVGPATSALSLPERTFTITYTGTATAVSLKADSVLGQGLDVAAGSTSVNKTTTLRAQLVDANGYWVPTQNANITLAKVGAGTATTPPATLTSASSSGKASFTVTTTGNVGEDVYQVSAPGFTTSGTVAIKVVNAVPTAPVILAARGVQGAIPGAPNYVSPTDTGLEIELAQDLNQGWVTVRVYREGVGSPTYTSKPILLSSGAPRVVVPKASLPSGISRYQVTVVNGHGESARSLATNNVTNANLVSNITLTSARYQAATSLLTLYGSGFTQTTDTVNPGLLTITDTSTDANLPLGGAGVTINNSGQMTLNLTTVPNVANLSNPALFSGSDVAVTASTGWYTRANGDTSATITTGAQLTPMASINHLVLDRVNRRLQVVGQGFTTGNLNAGNLKLQVGGSSDIVLSTFSNSRLSDTLWNFNLTQAAVDSLLADAGYVLNATDGWFSNGAWTQSAVSNVVIYSQVTLSTVTYDDTSKIVTLTGAGFTGGLVDMSQLSIRDLSTTQQVTLAGSYAFDGDTVIKFTLDAGTQATFENTANFQGSDIYLLGNEGWFTDSLGRQAAEIPDRAVRFPTR